MNGPLNDTTEINTTPLDLDMINWAITSGQLIIVPDFCVSEFNDDFGRVTEIKKHNRARKDGLLRYIVHYTEYRDADYYSCGCGGNVHGSDDKSLPLTATELSDTHYFYPQQRICITGYQGQKYYPQT